jgi:outer membrane protein OmpA-like peptidoglycan-associated protein
LVAACAFFVGLALTLSVRLLMDRIPAYLYDEARSALWAVGISGAEIAFDGRDAVLTGVKGSPHVSERAVRAVKSVVGVRDVRVRYLEATLTQGQTVVPAIPQAGEITFQAGSAALTLSSLPTIDRVVDFLRRDGAVGLEIQGHTDSDGDPNLNLLLSQSRAESVRKYMIMKGVDPSRLAVSGFGSTVPRAPNSTEAGRRANRRIEFRIRGVT